ncbi:helix-turn-helix transcriptional regulator [Geomonas agri]|uniref:helix-turn-helix transcriptional regulator n=1 Tax=Geomonas agri TaxID=2873702 RepID=UPI001CD6CEFC|nr:AlpA family phage regulatory protein [Geomonas agri]
MDNAIQLYRMKDLTSMLKRSRTQIYDDIAAGKFPRGILLGERTRAWTRKELEEWLAGRPVA